MGESLMDHSALMLRVFTEIYIFPINIYSFFVLVKKLQAGKRVPGTWNIEIMAACSVLLFFFSRLRLEQTATVGVWMYAGLILLYSLILAVLICGHRRLIYWQKDNISLYVLKEAMDDLPAGLCFFSNRGLPLMINMNMRQICEDMTGGALFNVFEFVSNIEEYLIDSFGEEEQIYSFDGRIYRIKKEAINDYTLQMVVTDITRLWSLSEELKEKNAKADRFNMRLRDYNCKVGLVVKESELLKARIRLHDEIGRILLATRRYLLNTDMSLDKDVLIRQWRDMIQLLRNDVNMRIELKPYEEIGKAAKSLGLNVNIDGNMPEDARSLHLIMSGARECMTNAIHGDAHNFCITIREKTAGREVIYTNDGKDPVFPVCEKGGLAYLRRIAEKEGAVMAVSGKPPISITLVIPYQEGGLPDG